MQDLIKTKIIATIGPATETEEMIAALIKAGTRVFRINSSHETPVQHLERIKKIRKVAKELNQNIPIMLDLQGPKIRVGNLPEPIELKKNEELILKPGMELEEPGIIPVDYPGIINDVRVGDAMLLDDGKIELVVKEIMTDRIKAEVIRAGILKSRKGLNIPDSLSSSLSVLGDRDKDYIKFSAENDIDYIALSFVRDKADIVETKEYISRFKKDIPVIAKIEKPQAVDNLESILQASDGVMVARGDLGIEISPENVPIVQKQIINTANRYGKSVTVATQMLDSMIESPVPTRAEASDVANAIIDGADALLLTGETTIGKYPVEVIEMTAKIAVNIEKANLIRYNEVPDINEDIYEPDSQAIADAIVNIIPRTEISAVIALTSTGYTAKLLSKSKPSVPVIALTGSDKVCRALNLFRGVTPFKTDIPETLSEDALKKKDEFLIKETFLSRGDNVIITGALPRRSTGGINFMRLHRLGSLGIMG